MTKGFTTTTYVIAEAASNHLGDIRKAKRMIWAAKEAGCQAVKFQSWQTSQMRSNDPDREHYTGRELSDEDHFVLQAECRKAGIDFMTSIFDRNRIPFLRTLKLKALKIPSTYSTNTAMLKDLRGKFPFLILSTGMTEPTQVRTAASTLKTSFALLHCISLYPAKLEDIHMNRMNWLKQFTPVVGWSDHTVGVEASQLACAMGATIIEKHFDLKKDPKRPFNATPAELKLIVQYSQRVSTMQGKISGNIQPDERTTKKQYNGKFGS